MSCEARSSYFQNAWLDWLPLIHFLGVAETKSVLTAAVSSLSENALDLRDLFDQLHWATSCPEESWVVRPREVSPTDKTAKFLQDFVRSVLWRTDSVPWLDSPKSEAHTSNADEAGHVALERTQKILCLGGLDIQQDPPTWTSQLLSDARVSSQVRAFITALVDARRLMSLPSEDRSKASFPKPTDVVMPYEAVLTKHIADLCADADLWEQALQGYLHCQKLLEAWSPPDDWSVLRAAWTTFVTQSVAMAQRFFAKGDAKETLRQIASSRDYPNDLFAINASLDAYVLREGELFSRQYRDDRVLVFQSPFLADNISSVLGLESSARGQHGDSPRLYWAALRRQLALGLATESNSTRAFLGREYVEGVQARHNTADAEETFLMGIRLLVEACDLRIIEGIRWERSFVNEHVNTRCVQTVISSSRRFEAVCREREVAVGRLFLAWIPLLESTKRDEILVMWSHLASASGDFPAEMTTNIDVARTAMKGLQELAKRMPQFRAEVSTAVYTALKHHVGKKAEGSSYWAIAEALETSLEYVDAWSGEEVESLASLVVEVLGRIDVQKARWTITSAAVNFLVLAPNKEGWRASTLQSSLEQIMRFGLENASEVRNFIVRLHDWDKSLLARPDVRNVLQPNIDILRVRSKQHNSSDCIGCICSLLLVPQIAGVPVLNEVLHDLSAIIDSETSRSPAQRIAYKALLELASNYDNIQKEFGIDAASFVAALNKLESSILRFWARVAEHPGMLAQLAFPPEVRAHKVLVHNWAFASMQLAAKLGRTDELKTVLQLASQNPELGSGIQEAIVTNALAFDADYDPKDSTITDAATFYATLGARLVLAQKAVGHDVRDSILKPLLLGVLAWGPRGQDIAVWLASKHLIVPTSHARDVQNYQTRLIERDLRDTLGPVVRWASQGLPH